MAAAKKAYGVGNPVPTASAPLTGPGPFLCYLTIDGLHRTDPGKLIALCGRIHAAARTAAEGRATIYHATDSTITIGIRGPDAADRINSTRSSGGCKSNSMSSSPQSTLRWQRGTRSSAPTLRIGRDNPQPRPPWP